MVENDEMKKCPYCAEMIKEEAIVCRYCGRDLPESEEERRLVKPERGKERKPTVQPIAKKAAIIAAVPASLVAFAPLAAHGDTPQEMGSIFIGGPLLFLILWGISALAIWIYRQRGVGALVLIVGIFGVIGVLSWVAANSPPQVEADVSALPTSDRKVNPRPNSTVAPPSTSECISWREVTSQTVGETVCLYGVIGAIRALTYAETSTDFQYIYFGDSSTQFIIHKSIDPDARVGACVYVRGFMGKGQRISMDDMPLECESWMNSE